MTTRANQIRNNLNLAHEAVERAFRLYGAEYNQLDALGRYMRDSMEYLAATLEVFDRFEREGKVQ